MRIAVAEIHSAPGGVDTAEDLQAVRQRLTAVSAAKPAIPNLADMKTQLDDSVLD